MSLKIFHLFFITTAFIALAIGGFAMVQLAVERDQAVLHWLGLASLAGGFALFFYGIAFAKKIRQMSLPL